MKRKREVVSDSDNHGSNSKSNPRPFNLAFTAIICIYILVAAEGASHVFSFENRRIFTIYAISFSLFASIWAVQDAKSKNIPFYYLLRLLYLFTCPLSTLVCLIYTPGWRGLGWAIVNLILIVSVSNSAYFAAYYLVYFSGNWELYDPVHLTTQPKIIHGL